MSDKIIPTGKGILEQIKENTKYADLQNTINDALFGQLDKTANLPSITLYTGLTGMYVFDLCMMGFGTPLVHYTFEHYKRKFGIITLNLFKKSGMIKAIINKRTRMIEIREGTQVIKKAFKFEEIKDYLASLTPKEPQEFYLRNGVRKYIK